VLLKRLYSKAGNGPTGKVDVPAVGLLIGEFSGWDLTMREDDPHKGLYDLRASFSTLNRWMFDDPSLDKRILIEIGRGKQYRLIVADDARTVLDGTSLLIEGVRLARPDGSSEGDPE
jgi:hypothetical protein